ncbi:unnamed protein product [Onchocerca ochengi]|uniref:Secreted protein n=1 Tax=Onchocerca ochengi TaxID=42157 RepID=A0A182E4S4_ONCOC|nr:unnamed protein product [Onchocerca ochengi]
MMTPRPAILRPMRLQALQKFFMLIPRIPPVSVQQPALCPVEAAFSERKKDSSLQSSSVLKFGKICGVQAAKAQH